MSAEAAAPQRGRGTKRRNIGSDGSPPPAAWNDDAKADASGGAVDAATPAVSVERLVWFVHNGNPAEKASVCKLLGAIFRLGNASSVIHIAGLTTIERPLPARTRVAVEDLFIGLQVNLVI